MNATRACRPHTWASCAASIRPMLIPGGSSSCSVLRRGALQRCGLRDRRALRVCVYVCAMPVNLVWLGVWPPKRSTVHGLHTAQGGIVQTPSLQRAHKYRYMYGSRSYVHTYKPPVHTICASPELRAGAECKVLITVLDRLSLIGLCPLACPRALRYRRRISQPHSSPIPGLQYLPFPPVILASPPLAAAPVLSLSGRVPRHWHCLTCPPHLPPTALSCLALPCSSDLSAV